MVRLAVLGPNLRDQSKGQFHVHNANCRDLYKHVYKGIHADVREYDSFQQVVEDVYSDIIADNGDDWSVYVNDFHVCPCVNFVR